MKTKKKATSYTVTFERDEEGWWVASVREVAGCHTQGRTIEQARRRVREALALFVDDADDADLVDDVKLPAGARRALAQCEKARRQAKDVAAKAQDLTQEAARVLTADLGLSVRDASALLGLSHQRVQQLVHDKAG